QTRNATMTGAGSMGTPAFMPHEQARGRWEQVGPRTDIWALGATMFTLATGRCVHEADTLQEVLLGAMTKRAPALATIAAGMPPPFCRLIDKTLEYNIDERWPDARAMQAALRAAYHVLDDGPVTDRGIGDQVAPPPRLDAPKAPPEAMMTGPRPPPEIPRTPP